MLIDLKNTYNQNAEIVEVNIEFDCENSIVLENLIKLNRACNQNAEITKENIGFHYE